MHEEKLRLFIRREVRKALEEARTGVNKVPQTWDEFRIAIAGALKRAGAPESMVFMVGDLNDESSMVAPLFSAWENMEHEMREAQGDGDDIVETWNMLADPYAEDIVYGMMDQLKNSWNFGPDDAPRDLEVVPEELALDLADEMQLH